MNEPISPAAVSGLRQRFIEDMTVRGFSEKTCRYYIRIVAGFAAFLGRSPDTATAEDIRRFQVHQSELGMHAPAMNSTVAALPRQGQIGSVARRADGSTVEKAPSARRLIPLIPTPRNPRAPTAG